MTVTAWPRMKTALEAASSSISRSPPRGEHCSKDNPSVVMMVQPKAQSMTMIVQ